MSRNTLRERVAQLARRHLADGDVTGWFGEVYRNAEGDMSLVPWAHGEPDEWLVRWLAEQSVAAGARAVVVGCGLGDDAEALAAFGYQVTALDVSSCAIDWCRHRFVATPVHYEQADLLQLPRKWRACHDLVYDGYTLQSMPRQSRAEAMEQLVRLAAPGARLLLICSAGPDGAVDDGPPWPVSREELVFFEERGLALNRFEDFTADSDGMRRFVAEYRLPGSTTMPVPPSVF